jgi:DNA invertase Pin-like site-specific DNA recombinase
MTATLLVPAAQYLRMSTEHQQYSLENQASAISHYAAVHGFVIVRTYSDSARSGLQLKNRFGLRQLLQDVTASEKTPYQAILVYDVSRWGRFQDTDEAAHWEFVCKSGGIPIHYCAETFPNDNSMLSSIMKALKRVMAGEYSRELSAKVFDGHKRLALLGFKQGGRAGYGLRRLLLSEDGKPKQLLSDGERKSLATDRVVLVPGPEDELRHVREIYRLFVKERPSMAYIARELNRRGVRYIEGSRWNAQAVRLMLTHPKYTGCQAYGRTSTKLCSPRVRIPKADWVLRPKAFPAIIHQDTFDEAQRILLDQTCHKTDEQLLEELRALLAAEGRLSRQIIERSYAVPSLSTYVHRFGSLQRAYELAGWRTGYAAIDVRQRTRGMRDELMNRLQSMFPNEVSVVRQGGRWRSQLRLRDGLIVSVLIARSVRTWKSNVRWRVDPILRERPYVTLLARLSEDNRSFLDFHAFPNVHDPQNRHDLRLDDPWLNGGKRLNDLSQFLALIRQVRARPEMGRTSATHGIDNVRNGIGP